MEKMTLVLLVITNVLIVLLLAVFGFFIYRLIKQQASSQKDDKGIQSQQGPQQYHPAIVERLKEAQRLKPRKSELYCPNHPDEPGETMCAICDRLFCRACIKPFKTLHFCKEHVSLVMRHDWEGVLTIKTSTTDPEHGVRLYDRKKEVFQNDELPTYIETHYKINLDQDYIETYLVLFSIRENVARAKELFLNV